VDAETTIPDYVEITADAKDFELGLTMTMASANVLSDLGFSDYDNSDAVNKIGDDMDKLQSSMQQLIDGGQKISDGTKSLKEGSAALKDGVNAYTGGVSQLTAGAKKLNDSISTLTDGTQKLSDGVKLLKQKLSQAKSSDDVKKIQSLYQSYQNIYNTLTNPNDIYKQAEVSVGKLSGIQTQLTDLQNSVKDVRAETLNQKLLEAGMKKANDTVAASEKTAVDGIKNDPTAQAAAKMLLKQDSLKDDQAKTIYTYALIQAYQNLAANKQSLTLDLLNQPEFQTQLQDLIKQSTDAYFKNKRGVEGTVQKYGSTVSATIQKAVSDGVSKKVTDADAYNTILNPVKAEIKKQYPSMSDTDVTSNADLITKAAIKNAIDEGMDFNPDTFSDKIQTYVYAASSTLSGIQTDATAAKGITKEEAAKEQPTRGYEKYEKITDPSQISPEDKTWLAATGMTQKEWDYLSTWSRVTDDANANTGAEYLVKYNAFMIKFAMIQSAYNSVQSKLSELSNGVDQLDAGTSQLLNGISQQLAPGVLQLYNGAAKLNANSAALSKGASQLYEGAGQLADGSATLSDGLVQFNDEGIAKLSEAFTGEVSQFADQLKAVDDAGKSYTTFSGKADDMNSSVKFIIETDEISKDSKN
jgi:putative membrane protein